MVFCDDDAREDGMSTQSRLAHYFVSVRYSMTLRILASTQTLPTITTDLAKFGMICFKFECVKIMALILMQFMHAFLASYKESASKTRYMGLSGC
jgi:hypothetical protein